MHADDALERRRQVLIATIALQRFALRSDIGTLRKSLRARTWWEAPLGVVRLAWFATRCWGVAAAAVRLVRR